MNKSGAFIFSIFLLTTCVSAATSARAQENPDRKQPVNIEADRGSFDDRNKVQVFEGRVILTQGSLVIKGDKLVVTQGADGFQTGVATANPPKFATFRQKRAESDEIVEGEADRIEYDSRTEKAKLFTRARVVSSNGDEVRGDYIEYDALTENYYVKSQPGTKNERVHAVIQPKGSSAQ